MSTKDNPGTLSINLYLTEQPTSQPFDFGKIGEVQGETAVTPREGQGKERSSDLVQSSGDIRDLKQRRRRRRRKRNLKITFALSE